MILFLLGVICGAVAMLVIIALVTTYQIHHDHENDIVASHKAPKY